MKKVAILVSMLTLSGCASYDLALMDQKSGKSGHGLAKANDSVAVIELDGKTYAGKFSYRSDSTYSVPSISQADNLPPAMEAKRAKQSFVGGNGSIFARSADNSGLRCVFAMNSRTQNGSGACLDDQGTIYDFQVN